MKQTIHLLFALLLGSVASADTNEPQYITMKSIGDVFSVSGSGIGFMMTDVPYGDWSQKQSGLYFPLNVSPVYSGLVAGVKLEKPDKLTPEKFSNQEKDFAEFVNDKNPNGARSQPPALKPGETLPSKLASDVASTYVVQTVVSTVINRPFADLGLGQDKLVAMAKSIDKDHFHYVIPGKMALAAFDEGHIVGKNFDTNKDYLLSVFDLRTYDCVELKEAVDLYFKTESEKQPLWKKSIYVISDLRWNDSSDLKAAEAMLGRRPTAALVQHILYADHLVKGAENIFLFFAEEMNGKKVTRAVFVSNLGLSSKLLAGRKAEYFRPYLFDGMQNTKAHAVTNAVLTAKQGVDDAKQAVGTAAKKVGNLIGNAVGLSPKKPDDGGVGDLLDGANAEMEKENKCDRGLGLGLIKYSKSLFSSFAEYLAKSK